MNNIEECSDSDEYYNGGEYPGGIESIQHAVATEIPSKFRALREHFSYVWKNNDVVSTIEDVDGATYELELDGRDSMSLSKVPGWVEVHKKETVFVMLGATALTIGGGALYHYRERRKKSD